ncbi:MAG TPA: DEDD exonuclease domain-containing protein [Acidimicrobiales bacterium]|nr:DEDD exonuclease domain-containing protein [Acidimicrobiales bacterium]
MAAWQRSFDDLGTPLFGVTFVVLDLETTGCVPGRCAITEVGAVKLRGGECLGTFQTLVDPEQGIPPEITYLTGITTSMVTDAPRIGAVLPSFLEFLGDAVIVGHNVRFDLSFLNAALAATGRPRLANRSVDTCALARRLVGDEVPNAQLSTLSRHFRVRHQPTHRALDDALATGEVLHCLLERAGRLGVLALDDLLELPTVKGHPMVAKLKLAADLPRSPGVYQFRDAGGRVLYVGKAVNLRRRVRSYFAGDERRKVGQLLRETAAVDHVVCSGDLEASVLEIRLIHELRPRFNRRAKDWKRYAYVKLTLDERFPRLSVVRDPRPGDGCLYLGPLPSQRAAQLVVEAVHSATPVRRCTARPGRTPRAAPCAPAQLGVAACPCAGGADAARYPSIVDTVLRGLTTEPARLLGPLEARMRALAAEQRYEEAAATRERAAALASALARQRRLDALRRAGRVDLEVEGEGGAVLDRGRLVSAGAGTAGATPLPFEAPAPADAGDGPLPRHLADEVLCVASWLDRAAGRVRLARCDAPLVTPLPELPRFEPGGGTNRQRRPPGPAASLPVGAQSPESGRPKGSPNDSGPAAAPSSPRVASPS